MIRRSALALVAALAVLPAPAPAQTLKPDYRGWQALLSRYCRVISPRGRPCETRFDYEQLYVDEGIWRKRESERLTQVRSQLLATPPSRLDPRDRLAWAINTYNFLVVERATLHLLVPGRKFTRYSDVNDMITTQGGFFDAPVVELDGRPFSLAQFERVMVYGDSTPMLEPRQRGGDPRIGFALCHGAVGCGPLQPRAFLADSLEKQLDFAARSALGLPRVVRADAATGLLEMSGLFDRNRADYGGTPAGAIPFVGRFGPAEARSVIRRLKPTMPTRFRELDWGINQWDRPRLAAPDSTRGAS